VAKRNLERTEKLRQIIRYMLERGSLAVGHQARLGKHFNLTRQRVHQVVTEERLRLQRQRRLYGATERSAVELENARTDQAKDRRSA